MHTCLNHSIVTKTRATAPRVGESCYNGMLSFVVTVIAPSPHTPLHAYLSMLHQLLSRKHVIPRKFVQIFVCTTELHKKIRSV